jgi:protein ImuB
MRRVVSVFLPTWSTDRIRRNRRELPADAPLVAAAHDGRRRVVAGADRAARALGIRPGLPLAQAQARIAGLLIEEADPDGDAAALADLAAWCIRYTPLTAPAPPDGLWLDIAGCAGLWNGEAALVADLTGRLRRAGLAVRVAVADTPGAAHGLVRFGSVSVTIVPEGGQAGSITPLPVEALRLAADDIVQFRRLGIERIGDLMAIPRGPLTRRFGPGVLRRLDQALGVVPEPIEPVVPADCVRRHLAFAEPIATPESLAAAIAALAPRVCAALEAAGQGARRLDLICTRVDGAVQVLRAGTAAPVRDAKHITRLLTERLETLDPGLGIETMTLLVAVADPLGFTQPSTGLLGAAGQPAHAPGLPLLVDRLSNSLGEGRLWRAAAVESEVPERSVTRIPPLAPPTSRTWRTASPWPRPVRLLPAPRPVEVTALLPDYPPAQFVWRRVPVRVRRGDGPERIYGEWWKRDTEMTALRDYFRVEDGTGRRYWLYRRGDGADPTTGDGAWFLHGLG